MIVLNIGRRELGKSTLALYMVRKSARRIIFDPRGQFSGTKFPCDTWTGDERGESFFAPIAAAVDRYPELIFQPGENLHEAFQTLGRFVAYWIGARGRQELGVLVDEAGLVSIGGPWDYVMRCAPRESVQLIFTAHRPVDVPVIVRSIADVWCLFRMTQSNDLVAVEEKCGRAVADRLPLLNPREFVSWDDAVAQMSICVDPALWYVPIAGHANGITTSAEITL